MTKATAALELKELGIHPRSLEVASGVLYSLTFLAVGLRLHVKARILRGLTTDDYLLILSLVVLTADLGVYIAVCTTELNTGIIESTQKLSQLILAGECLYIMNQIVLKASLAFYFLRLVTRKTEKRVIQISTIIYELYTGVYFFLTVFQDGIPTAHNVLLGPDAPHAIHAVTPITYTGNALNILIDAIFVLIPIIVVSKAMLPIRTKVTVCSLIVLGAGGSVAACVRFKYLPAVATHDEVKIIQDIVPIAIISFAESCAGMITVSLATLRPLVAKLMPSLNSSKKSQNTKATGYGQGKTGIARQIDVEIFEERDDEYRSGSEEALRRTDLKDPDIEMVAV